MIIKKNGVSNIIGTPFFFTNENKQFIENRTIQVSYLYGKLIIYEKGSSTKSVTKNVYCDILGKFGNNNLK